MDIWNATKQTLRAGKAALTGAANATHAVAAAVKRHEPKVAAVTCGSVRLVAKTVELGGALVANSGFAAASATRRQAGGTENRVGRGASKAAGYVASAVGFVGTGAVKAGELTEKAAPVTGRIAGGLVTGATSAVSGAIDSVAITDHDIAALRAELEGYGRILSERADVRLAAMKVTQAQRRADDWLDTLLVGGVSLADALQAPERVPDIVNEAFNLQFPDLAKTETFTEAVHHADPQQLAGLVDGVKGKLFELSLLNQLNTPGQLPSGLHAVLAHSATQPGWDLKVVDSHGHIVDLIQAKATDSVEYIRQALDRYPNIDITTTHGVYTHMAAQGIAQHVHDSGVPLASLNGDVGRAVSDASAHVQGISFVPSSVSLAVIALSVLVNKRLTPEMAAQQFGSRSAKAGVAVGVANAAMVATQTWWIGLLAGVGGRLLVARGEAKRGQYQLLKDAVATLRPLLLSEAPQF